VQHAFVSDRRPLRTTRPAKRRTTGVKDQVGRVVVVLSHDAHGLVIEVRDNGIGLPKGFDIERTNSLGLSIVRDLVVTQLDGSIDMHRVARPDGGTLVRIEVPTGQRR
jgi:two-component sensor histidine kinase